MRTLAVNGAGRMICLAIVVGLIGGASAQPRGQKIVELGSSQWVKQGPDGKLLYHADEQGNRLPDFSYVGYMAGERAIPDVKVAETIAPDPSLDDHTELVQAAINKVAQLPIGGDGFRGTVLLRAGVYRIAGRLRINASGIVLRGEGDGRDGTILVALGYGHAKHKRTLITVDGPSRGPRVALDDKSRREITDAYVPIGATRFAVSSTAGLRVGDPIVVYRPSTQAWISAIGCDQLPANWTRVTDVQWVKPGGDREPGVYYQRPGISHLQRIRMERGESWAAYEKRVAARFNDNQTRMDTTSQWRAGDYDMHYERTITAIDGNDIVIDTPMVHPLDTNFGGGTIYKYTTPGRIENVGIEHLRLISQFGPSTDEHPFGPPKMTGNSEQHAWHGIVLGRRTRNTWVRHVTGEYFGWSLVSARGRNATVTDCVNLSHASKIAGGRRYPFMIDGQLNLVQRCATFDGRHEFVVQARTWGPNVFVDCIGLNSKSSAGPHHRYAAGTLFDNVSSQRNVESRYRGSSGTGHGWAGTQTVFYNCTAPGFNVSAPPGGISWVIGSGPAGDTKNNRVNPPSLYYQQLADRLGESAVDRVASPMQRRTIGQYRWLIEPRAGAR